MPSFISIVSPYITTVIMPVLVLVLHFKDTERKVKFLFFAFLANLGVTMLFVPLAFLPMMLHQSYDKIASASAIAILIVYLSVSFFLPKRLINRFMTPGKPGSKLEEQRKDIGKVN